MTSSLGEIEFLSRSGHRAHVLDNLAEGSCDRNDLIRVTGASSPTIGRILPDFLDRSWIDRRGPNYGLSPLGGFIAERFADFRKVMDTERRLRDVWRWLPCKMEGFSVDLFADAVVSYPGAGYPYEPVKRVTQLIEETTPMRGFGTTVFKSINNESVCRRVMEGIGYEYVYSPETLRATIAWNPRQVFEAVSRDGHRVGDRQRNR